MSPNRVHPAARELMPKAMPKKRITLLAPSRSAVSIRHAPACIDKKRSIKRLQESHLFFDP
jgi:hypothetical protein